MILQNISKAIREQNYYAVALEFVIVIAGVVIGFQIQAWAQTRNDRALEDAYLERLHADITCSAAGQAFNLDWDESLVSTQQIVLDALAAGVLPQETADAFARGLSTIGMHNPLRWRWGTVDELKTTGNITLIRNADLRDKLARMEADYVRLQSVLDEARAQIRLSKAKITNRFAPDEVGFITGDRSVVDYDFDALARDFGFRAEFAHIQVNSQLIIVAATLHRNKLIALEEEMEAIRGVRLANALQPADDFACEVEPVE